MTPGTAIAIPGYRAIDGGGPFAPGIVAAGATKVGIVRIGVFAPQGYPLLCEAAVAAERIAVEEPCDAACDDRLNTHAYAAMTRGLMTTLERLRAAGAEILLVDLARNGGGDGMGRSGGAHDDAAHPAGCTARFRAKRGMAG